MAIDPALLFEQRRRMNDDLVYPAKDLHFPIRDGLLGFRESVLVVDVVAGEIEVAHLQSVPELVAPEIKGNVSRAALLETAASGRQPRFQAPCREPVRPAESRVIPPGAEHLHTGRGLEPLIRFQSSGERHESAPIADGFDPYRWKVNREASNDLVPRHDDIVPMV